MCTSRAIARKRGLIKLDYEIMEKLGWKSNLYIVDISGLRSLKFSSLPFCMFLYTWEAWKWASKTPWKALWDIHVILNWAMMPMPRGVVNSFDNWSCWSAMEGLKLEISQHGKSSFPLHKYVPSSSQ